MRVSRVLTAPVLFAVMAQSLFGADWVPAVLLNRWGTARVGHTGDGLRRVAGPPHRLTSPLALRLSPMIAAAAMALSSLSVVGNANRLRRHHTVPLPAPEPVSVEPRVETGTDRAAEAVSTPR